MRTEGFGSLGLLRIFGDVCHLERIVPVDV
jgi:hypothetical protein